VDGAGAGLALVSFLLLPPAGALLPTPSCRATSTIVFGFNDAQPAGLDARWPLSGVWMLVLFTLTYLPSHLP